MQSFKEESLAQKSKCSGCSLTERTEGKNDQQEAVWGAGAGVWEGWQRVNGAGTIVRYTFILTICSYLLLPYFVTEILTWCQQSVEYLIPFIQHVFVNSGNYIINQHGTLAMAVLPAVSL